MIGQLQKAKAWVRFAIRGIAEEVNMISIPTKWEKFMNTNDEWIELPFPPSEDTTACLYKAKKGSVFPPHFHSNNIEQTVVISGELEAFTPTWNKIVGKGDSVQFEMGEKHCVEFLEDTVIMVIWHPQMEGWNSVFV